MMSDNGATSSRELALTTLRQHDKFLLTTHERPDGDAVGSLGALDASVDRVERWLLDRFPETVRVERSLTSFEDAGGLG